MDCETGELYSYVVLCVTFSFKMNHLSCYYPRKSRSYPHQLIGLYPLAHPALNFVSDYVGVLNG